MLGDYLNPSLETRLEDVVRECLGEGRSSSPGSPYWYPLSRATTDEQEILAAMDCLFRQRTTMGEKTSQFEQAFAKRQGCDHAIMVNSGSSADLLLSLLLTDPVDPILQPGDEILVPAVTWPTQAWSPMMAGLSVRLVDVSPQSLNVDVETLERARSDKTKAVFLVHLMGNPCAMDRIVPWAAEHGIVLLEDCCEAMGATFASVPVGNFGLGAAFSFFFSHHITTMEGGMMTVAKEAHADRLRVLRSHGWARGAHQRPPSEPGIDDRYLFVDWGLNVRPTEVQAAFGLKQLDKWSFFESRRRALAARFEEFLSNHPFLRMPHVEVGAEPSWMTLPMMVEPEAPFSRDEITSALEKDGIETRPIVAGNLIRQPVTEHLRKRGLSWDDCPGAEEIHQRGFYVGLSPMNTDDEMSRLLDCLEKRTATIGGHLVPFSLLEGAVSKMKSIAVRDALLPRVSWYLDARKEAGTELALVASSHPRLRCLAFDGVDVPGVTTLGIANHEDAKSVLSESLPEFEGDGLIHLRAPRQGDRLPGAVIEAMASSRSSLWGLVEDVDQAPGFDVLLSGHPSSRLFGPQGEKASWVLWEFGHPGLDPSTILQGLGSDNTTSSGGGRLTARQLVQQGEQAFSENDLERAHDLFFKAIEREPGHVDAWNDIAVCLDALGLPREALEALQEALRLDPANEVARGNYDSIHQKLHA